MEEGAGVQQGGSFSLRSLVPWQAKIAAKLVLSRVPVDYGFWRRLALFRHGQMERPAYAYRVFRRHFDRAKLAVGESGFVAMEIGPGDSLLSAMIAGAYGATKTYLIDVGNFAKHELGSYRDMERFMREQGLPVPDISSCQSVQEVLSVCQGEYLTTGLPAFQIIPDRSVDFVWSQAVLEHVRRAEFLEFSRQMHRVLRADGVCSHRIDLMDHLGGALNNLRFSERVWESDFMARSGFYTNRLRYSEMLTLFEQAGFAVEVLHIDRWQQLPTPKHKLAEEFKNFSDNELCVCGFDVTLRPA
jgi:predicted SAM-dependent methyltransferase